MVCSGKRDNSLFDSKAKELKSMGMNLKVMDEIIPSVSSSEIRADFKTAQKLLPKNVFEFLIERGVYSE